MNVEVAIIHFSYGFVLLALEDFLDTFLQHPSCISMLSSPANDFKNMISSISMVWLYIPRRQSLFQIIDRTPYNLLGKSLSLTVQVDGIIVIQLLVNCIKHKLAAPFVQRVLNSSDLVLPVIRIVVDALRSIYFIACEEPEPFLTFKLCLDSPLLLLSLPNLSQSSILSILAPLFNLPLLLKNSLFRPSFLI
jgi:hypothetical protein